MMKFIWPLVASALGLAVPTSTFGQELSYDTYGAWRAVVMQVEGGEESWLECTASTGGDGDPTVRISARQYDAGPPDVYPMVEVTEYAPRHYRTVMQEGGRVTFAFDSGESYQGIAHTGLSEGVFQFATVSPSQNVSLPVLQAMRKSRQLDIIHEGRLVYSASLNGFTAAYGKIAEACQFSTMGVMSSSPQEQDEVISDAGGSGTLLSEQFGVWRTRAEDFMSDGSPVRECYASIPNDGGRQLSFGINSLEAAPPDSFPPLVLSESIPETVSPMVARGGTVQFVFDTGLILPGEVMTDFYEEGARYIDATVKSGYRDLALREMKRSTTLWVYGDGVLVYQTALTGFSEAYGAMANVCMFSTAGVLD